MSGAYLRLPWKWSADPCLRRELSAEAFRTYVFATLWSGKEMTDGWIERGQALETVADGSTKHREAIWDELIEFGLAREATRAGRRREQDGFQLVEFLDEQLPASHWEKKRRNDAERKRRSREKQKASGGASSDRSPRQSPDAGGGVARSTSQPSQHLDSFPTSGGSDTLTWDVPS